MKIPFLTRTNNFKKVRHDVRHLRKTLEYLKIQESLRSEKFLGVLFMLRQYFDMFFSTPNYIPQAKNKINHELASPL